MLVKCHSVLLRCYYVISVCDSHPCLFGGTCTPLDSSTYQCRCAAGFSGTHCQIIGKFYILNDFETPQNTHKETSLTLPLFIQVPVISKESKQSCICLLEVLILSLSMILILDFRIVQAVWYFLLSRKSKYWLTPNQDNVSEWGDMSMHGLLFQ
jgi:hypothetical protein